MLLRQLLSEEAHTLSIQHYRHVALRLLRRLSRGTRGSLELRYLLDDLLAGTPPTGQGGTLHDDIRQLGELLSSISIPLIANPPKAKRHLSADPEEKDGHGGHPKRTKRALEDVQMLYNYLIPLPAPVSSAAGVPSPAAPSIKSLLAKPGRSAEPNIPGSDSIPTLQHLFARLKTLIPIRGRFIARARELERLCSIPSPTTDDTLAALGELGDTIAELCAPVRDAEAQALKDTIAASRQYRSLGSPLVQESINASLRQTGRMVEHMHRDMKQFSLGLTTVSHSEEELGASVRAEGMKRERAAIGDLLDAQGGSALSRTSDWQRSRTGEATISRTSVLAALIDALFSSAPVNIRVEGHSTPSSNVLPPILYSAHRHLLIIQNWLQAIVILATLSTLVTAQTAARDWTERVWTLLAEELESGSQESPLRLASIADEVIRASGQHLAADRVAKIRMDVARMVRLDDPVYKLLSRRLRDGLVAAQVDTEATVGQLRGYHITPLPVQIDEVHAHIRKLVYWACECWQIPG